MKMATAGINHLGEHTHLLPLSGEMLWPVLKVKAAGIINIFPSISVEQRWEKRPKLKDFKKVTVVHGVSTEHVQLSSEIRKRWDVSLLSNFHFHLSAPEVYDLLFTVFLACS